MLALVPLLTVGHYYVVSDWWHLTQVEGLVGLPLYLAAWLTARPVGRATPWWLFLGGVMGGVVLLFKLMLLPIVLVFALTAFGERRRSTPQPFGRTLGETLIPVAGGMMVPAAAALAACLWTASLEVALWTWFAFPLDVLREIPTPSQWRLLGGLSWFAQGFSWLAALAVLGAVVGARRRDPLAVNLIGWCGDGLSVILAQTQSWSGLPILPPARAPARSPRGARPGRGMGARHAGPHLRGFAAVTGGAARGAGTLFSAFRGCS